MPDNAVEPVWRRNAVRELDQALAARRIGNEGKARVCARRAAGHIAGEYFKRIGVDPGSASAHTRLQILRSRTEVSALAREIADHLLLRSTPEFTLPIPVDLITEARQLALELLGVDLTYS